jgi:hypothetical protein
MAAEAVLFISQHSNAVGTPNSGTARGVEVYYSVDLPGDKDFAAALSKAISAVMGNPDRGAKTNESQKHPGEDFYSVIDATQDAGCPHVFLVESGFHDNLLDEAILKQDAKLQEIAEAQAAVIHKFLSGAAPEGLTPIMGKAVATAEQMRAYIEKVYPEAPQAVLDLPGIYLTEGEAEGVRGDIAFAQAMIETGNFKFKNTAVTLEQNNFCGMGVTQNGMKGNSFPTPQIGVRAQIQHLKAYAAPDLVNNAIVDPRFTLVMRGCAPYVEHLGQKENPNGYGWATGAGYGAKILTVLSNILKLMPSTEDTSAPAEALPEGVKMAPIQINGMIINMPLILAGGRNYPQLNALCAALGFKLSYDAARGMAVVET